MRRTCFALATLIVFFVAMRPASACLWGRSALQEARKFADEREWSATYSFARGYDEKADLGALLPFTASAELLEAQHLVAVAVARLPDHLGADERGGDPQTNLHWAALVLRWQMIVVEHSPRREVELAHALAGLRYHADLARRILLELAARDVMPNLDGWALLARLEHDRGDARAETEARARCRALADATTSPACGT